MAEATGLRNNALNYPVYGAPFGIVFGIWDNDGDLVTGAANLDSEVSKNGDGMADCTNEATEIATTSGMYYLLLTATELTADVVTGITKTSTTDAKTTSWSLYPRKLVTVRSGTAAGGAAGYITLDASASAVDDYYNGLVCIATIDGNVEARIITDYTGSNKQAAVTPDWNVTPDSDDTFVIKLPEGAQLPTVDVTLWKGATAPAMTGDAYAQIGVAGAGLTAFPQMPTTFMSELTAQYGVETTFLLFMLNKAATAGVSGLTWNGVDSALYLATDSAFTLITTVVAHAFGGGFYVATLSAAQMQFKRAMLVAMDASGAGGRPVYWTITTYGNPAAAITDMPQTGDSYAAVTNATYGLDKLARTGADSDTLETLSDQIDGVSTLTQQEVRDAMKLAPTAGAPAAGSVDAHLDDILEDTGTTLPGALTTIDDYLDTEVAAIKAKTDNLPASPAATGAAMTLTTGERASIATAVWAATTRTLTSLGTVVADAAAAVWAYAVRTLTTPAQTAETQAAAGALEIVRGVTYSTTLSGVSFPATWVKCYFTAKRNGQYEDDANDDDAIIQVLLTKPAAVTDGLQRLNGAVATAAEGSLTATEGASTLDLLLADDATIELVKGGRLTYDVKFILSDGSSVRERSGALSVVATPTATV